jgi:putative restriction endonuclease
MRYWWVNQNQTYRQEIGGGYLWSPQRNANGARNPFYESMREVAPGDLIFSFVDTRIRAVGAAQSYCYECPKPIEFGSIGMNWDTVGWRVDVRFKEEPIPIRPKDYIDVLRPHLPPRYAPLRANGDGLQSLYLTELPRSFAETLATLMGRPVLALVRGDYVADVADGVATDDALPAAALQWERLLTQRIESDPSLTETQKEALVLARRGQGIFKRSVRRLEFQCRVTKVDRLEHLRASHCKPWRDSNNQERLDGENGLLLTPTIDHLFDRGFISFEDGGQLLISPGTPFRSDSLRGGAQTQAVRQKRPSRKRKAIRKLRRRRLELPRYRRYPDQRLTAIVDHVIDTSQVAIVGSVADSVSHFHFCHFRPKNFGKSPKVRFSNGQKSVISGLAGRSLMPYQRVTNCRNPAQKRADGWVALKKSVLADRPPSTAALGLSQELRKIHKIRKMRRNGGRPMQFINSSDAAKKFGAIAQLVQSEPVCVQSHGRPQMVMLSPAEYERLRRQDRRVYATTQLPASLRAAIAAAQPSAQAASFDHEAKK